MQLAFYRRLASTALSDTQRVPRIYLAARGHFELIHGQIDLGSAISFMNSYQGKDALTLAELWAFPAMLRLVSLEEIIAGFSELAPQLRPPFELPSGAETVSDHDPTQALSRAIVALASIERIDWKAFVEATSHVEAILRTAPDGLHAAMDFETRDRYRRAIEDLAEGADRTEPDIAREAVRMSSTALMPRQTHVGWWLIDGGRQEFETRIGYRAQARDLLRRLVLRRPGTFYTAGLVLISVLALVLPLSLLFIRDASALAIAVVGLLLVMPAAVIAVTITNWLVTQSLPPRVLPKLDFEGGLAKGMSGAVIMPVILKGPEEVTEPLSQLERHWLTNSDPRLRYALLSDPADAPEEIAADDNALEAALAAGIRDLNSRYAPHAPFVLLHRRRKWNEADGIWMGWERKRGKIEEFNDFLNGGATDAFPVVEGDVDGLRGARLVVTLDSDTVAPSGAVLRLLGALAHPLNRAEFDAVSNRVVAGYTFIQPRIEVSPDAGVQSLFSRLYTGDTAIDIYSRAVSDVYQDLFGEGIFTGKGAYDASAFRRSLRGKVPVNALVSHDLFEGLHGRAALASDIVFYEGFPSRYPDFAQRLHRWIRGDWQLLPWLGPYVQGRDGGWLRTPLSILDRWKIIDNLRRSLLAPSLVLLALCGWLAMPQIAPIWTLITIAAPGTYLFTNLVTGISHGRRRGAVQDRWRQSLDHAGRWILEIVFMPNEAIVSLDAIARALWRLLVTRRRMLEWKTAAHVSAAGSDTRRRFWAEMAGAPMLSTAIAGALVLLAPTALPGALPLLLLWTLSPEIARLIGRRRAVPVEEVSKSDRIWLRRLARRTWAYFETFSGPEDNWLPPDNFQIDPVPEVAHRSSPTNVGMQLLSSLTALDMGHVGLRDIALRTEYALSALEGIERNRGHVVNWFDTRTLASLEPRYISTVDSGNLAVALLTLREGLIEAANGPALSPALWDGLVDTLGLLAEALEVLPDELSRPLMAQIDTIAVTSATRRGDPRKWRADLCQLIETDLPHLSQAILKALDAQPRTDPADIHFWLERSRHHVSSFLRDLDALSPWGGPHTATDLPEAALEVLRGLPPNAPPEQLHDASVRLGAIGDAYEPQLRIAGLQGVIDQGRAIQTELRDKLVALAERAEAMATEMDFSFLYDHETRTFFIGYNLSFDRMDAHRYDLLASEARLASYFAIAKGDVPAEHWFHLGRPISRSSGALTVLSWNGSMFEYLMPALVLRSAQGQLLGQSEGAAVDIQRRYGERLGLPWGVSEAAFSARDAAQRYQYRAFGVAGLGMRQGLAEDYVVAPYASALALSVRPEAAVENLRRLETLGLRGRYGFYDAVDFTPSRVESDRAFTPVQTYMAHHQGMLLAAIGNALCEDIHVRRFHRDPRIDSIDLLLHERVPWEYVPEPLPDAGASLPEQPERQVPTLHGWSADDTDSPQFHTLGNGRLSVWLSGAAMGTVWWHGQSLTKWSPDTVRDDGAARVFLRDAESAETWEFRANAEPHMDVRFHAEKATFHLQHHRVAATQEICVAAADDIEIRRVTLVNQGDDARIIDVTSYAEPVLAPHAAHERHPAFSKLFIRSEYLADLDALVFTRRPRRPGEEPPMMLHRLVPEDESVVLDGIETDRRSLLGRQGAYEGAAGAQLSGMAGWTLDPVSALRARVRLAPGQRARLAFLTFAAASREMLLDTAERYASAAALDWAFEDAARSVAVEADRFDMSGAALADAQRLAGHLLKPAQRSSGAVRTSWPGQPDLWGLGVSGDNPVILVRVSDADHADLLPAIVHAQSWLRRNGLRSDLVVLGTTASSYEAPIAATLRDALRDAALSEGLGGDGGVHLHSIDRIAPGQLRALTALAHITLDGAATSLEEALPKKPRQKPDLPVFAPGGQPPPDATLPLRRSSDLIFDNGLGGFSSDTGGYLIHLEPGQSTPVPWCNVLANDRFGTIVTEAGLGFTWSENSGEFRLTPWSNDPVTDRQGEAIYLRDEETAQVWSLSQLPAGGQTACRATHKPGETIWECVSEGLEQQLSVTVPTDAPVKLARLTLTNRTRRTRRITATYYAEWQLGATASGARPHVLCSYDAAAQALIARNGWQPAFAGQIAFLTASHPPHALTSDRSAFLGQGGIASPEGLRRWSPAGETDMVDDPCAAYQVHLDIAPGASEEVVFVLGAASGVSQVANLAREYASRKDAKASLDHVRETWAKRLGAVQVDTPDAALDLMVNRWLPHQSFASRILARAGFQQASGGIGFRDQLQDMMAFLMSEPHRVRSHILDCARNQFEEGDVLHWWHPPEGRGVRTRCSDDMLWLVYATARYVRATGDKSILDESLTFLTAPPLADDEEDRYAAFDTAGHDAPLLEHCFRAIQRGTTRGPNGLPLIGSGDWNDGMDRVGHRGRGESVWLAWFGAHCCDACADLADRAGQADKAAGLRTRADELREAAEGAGWDGAWYRRAFDDDGEPWGSVTNEECFIDSIAQSWAVLAGAPNRTRAEQAVRAAARELIDNDLRLVRLLTPPFDATLRNPGYIRAYPPGVRENGGQYTHAATWLGLAFARLGDGDTAYKIFDMINPIPRSAKSEDMIRYRGEPYVVPADVGGAPPFEGRAGWTWYTGAAAWTWRLAVEGLLGLELRNGNLHIDPCLPAHWSGYRATVRANNGAIELEVVQDAEGNADVVLEVDGHRAQEALIAFPTDGSTRRVRAHVRRREMSHEKSAAADG
ncbi:MAG: glucoamylase family protein [Pseudomonadota bacterium]